MSRDREAPAGADERFHARLERLRLKIDTLPERQRPHLIALAESIARQHLRLQIAMACDGRPGLASDRGNEGKSR